MSHSYLRDFWAEARSLAESPEYSDLSEFDKGFIVGQIEKLYIGACKACMFPWSYVRYDFCLEVASIYSKDIFVQKRAYGMTNEIWVHRGTLYFDLYEADTEAFHMTRALECGFEYNRVNPFFKLKGYHG